MTTGNSLVQTNMLTIRTFMDEIDRLKAELAASEIHWTDATPTTPGWWWWRGITLGDNPVPSYVLARSIDGALIFSPLGGQWSDKPIPLPKEPS